MAKKKQQQPADPTPSRYYTAESQELLRSQIHLADYNPRTITDQARQTLRRGIRKYGLVGGIVVNRQTGYTLVSGHQRLAVMDDLQHYNPDTRENDYLIRCDIVDLDPTAEKELLILLNNPNAQGSWDYDKLRPLIPSIDFKSAGLTEADLSMIGVDIVNQITSDTRQNLSDTITKAARQNNIAADIASFMGLPSTPEPQPDTDSDLDTSPLDNDDPPPEPEITDQDPGQQRQQKIEHMKQVKALAKEQSMTRAADQMAYLMLSFDNYDNMLLFLDLFDYPQQTQIIKGEEIIAMLTIEEDDNNPENTTTEDTAAETTDTDSASL